MPDIDLSVTGVWRRTRGQAQTAKQHKTLIEPAGTHACKGRMHERARRNGTEESATDDVRGVMHAGSAPPPTYTAEALLRTLRTILHES